MKKVRQDNDVSDYIGLIYAKKKLSCHNQFDRVRSTKFRQDNEMTFHTSVVYAKIKTTLTDQIECSLSWKLDRTMTWPIVQVWSP